MHQMIVSLMEFTHFNKVLLILIWWIVMDVRTIALKGAFAENISLENRDSSLI